MNIAEEQLDKLRESLRVVEAKGKLCVVAATSGIAERKLKQIVSGKVTPTYAEFSTLNMLRSM